MPRGASRARSASTTTPAQPRRAGGEQLADERSRRSDRRPRRAGGRPRRSRRDTRSCPPAATARRSASASSTRRRDERGVDRLVVERQHAHGDRRCADWRSRRPTNAAARRHARAPARPARRRRARRDRAREDPRMPARGRAPPGRAAGRSSRTVTARRRAGTTPLRPPRFSHAAGSAPIVMLAIDRLAHVVEREARRRRPR